MVDPERAEHMHAVVEREVARDDPLRQLVRRERGERDGGERRPLRRPGAERPLDDRDRREPVGRRAHADIGAPGGLRHALSAFRASSMQSDAHGWISRRSTPMSFPQTAHVPYVPSSIRFNAASISPSTWPEFSLSV